MRQRSILRWFTCVMLMAGAAMPSGRHAHAAGAETPPDARQWSSLPALPDSHGFAGMYAGLCGDALLAAGGANFPDGLPWEGGPKRWNDRIWVLDKPDGDWKPAGRLPSPRGYGVSLTVPGRGVLCAGGSDPSRHFTDVFILSWSPQGDLKTEPLPPLPEAMANGCGALIGTTVYIAGGESTPGATSASGRFWSLDLAAVQPQWIALPTWPGPPRTLAAAGVQAGQFYLIGGVALKNGGDGKPARERPYLTDGYAWDPKRQQWKRIADLPFPAAAAPSPMPALAQSHLLLIGADDGAQYGVTAGHTGFNSAMLVYHTITDTWTPWGTTEAFPQVTVPVVNWQGRHLLVSGEIRPGVRTPAVRVLQLSSRKAAFGWINYATLILYLAAVVWLGTSFSKRNQTTNDFFRGGQSVPWWAAGLSIFATMLSSITFMAIPAQSYSVGWNLILANSYLLLTPLVTLVYLPFYRNLNVTSAYEYLERRFNLATRMIASALFILFQCGRVAIVLYLPALALATVSRISVTSSILLMGVLCVIYTMEGGIRAVIWTDVAQAIVLLGGAVWALVTIILRVEGGTGTIIRLTNDAGRFLQNVSWDFDLLVAGGWIIMIGSIFSNLFSYTSSQDVVQRYLTTADRKSAARAIWTNAVISPIAQLLFFAIGTALFAFYRLHPGELDPLMPRTDSIFPLFIVRELPAGVAGLIVAGIFAAAQSTLSSSLNSMATAYVTDFHRRVRPQATDQACLKLAKWLTGVIGLAGTGIALVLAQADIRSLWETFLEVIGLFGGTISGLFVLGIFFRRANGAGELAGALASALCVGLVWYTKLTVFWVFPVIGVSVCVLTGWLASLMLPRPAAEADELTLAGLRRRAKEAL